MLKLEYPALYDSRLVRDTGKVEQEATGMYDYDENIFKVPEKFRKLFENKRKDDMIIMQSVGVEFI